LRSGRGEKKGEWGMGQLWENRGRRGEFPGKVKEGRGGEGREHPLVFAYTP